MAAEDSFRIFLSAVSSEFESVRDALAADLGAREALVRVQGNFRQEAAADTTLRKLHDYIRDCNAVVCIIGKRSGAFPRSDAAAAFKAMLPPDVEKASYTQWEFFFARYYQRRLSIYIANDHYVPFVAANEKDDPNQQEEFVKRFVEGQGLDRDYFGSEDRLCRLVLKEEWPNRKPNVDVERERLPYLADRSQIGRICSSVAERMANAKSAVDDHGQVRPILFIVPSQNDDASDMFHWRLIHKDGPQWCALETGLDSACWVAPDRLWWPGYEDPGSFCREFINANVQPVQIGLLQSRQRKRPVCFSAWVTFSEIEKKLREFIDTWIGCWPDLLEHAAQRSTQLPRGPTPPIVILLFLMFETGNNGFRRFWQRRDDPARRLRELELLDLGAKSYPIDAAALRPLGPITWGEASGWLTLPDIERHKIERPARDAVHDIFQDPQKRVPMKAFADAVVAAIQQYHRESAL
jgi:hypothetical protein